MPPSAAIFDCFITAWLQKQSLLGYPAFGGVLWRQLWQDNGERSSAKIKQDLLGVIYAVQRKSFLSRYGVSQRLFELKRLL